MYVAVHNLKGQQRAAHNLLIAQIAIDIDILLLSILLRSPLFNGIHTLASR